MNGDIFESVEVVEPGLIQMEINEDSEGGDIKAFDDEGKKKSQATLMIEIGKKARLFHDDQLDAYAEIERNGAKATMAVKSKEFRDFLAFELYQVTSKGANANALTDAIATLEAEAKFNGQKITVAVRVHNGSDYVAIDQGCHQRKVIKIDAQGWRYAEGLNVRFVRKRGMIDLPEPANAGDLSLLLRYLNINQDELPLVYGWMFCALGGVKPYPILVLQGEQGTGKSTTSRVIRSLVDPSSVPLRSPPKEIRDLLVSASNNHVVVLDNLSGLSPDVSDCLCRLSTGGGIDVRALYTDNEQVLIDIQRPVLINGIDDIATRPDLAERALIINLPVIDQAARKSEREFWAGFERDRPVIFAALIDAVASGLRHLNETKLAIKPRMADVALWVTACERGLGIEGQFIGAHTRNQQHAVELGIDASPIGSALMELMSDRERWTGKPTDLLRELENIAGLNQTKSRAWPQSPKGMKNAFTRLMPSFRKLGVSITDGKDGGGNRYYKIERTVLQVPYPPYSPYPTDDETLGHGTYTADREATALNRRNTAHAKPNRRTDSPRTAGLTALTADTAHKNPPFLFDPDDKEVF